MTQGPPQPRSLWKVTTWNCNGILTKRNALADLLTESEVLLIQESHWDHLSASHAISKLDKDINQELRSLRKRTFTIESLFEETKEGNYSSAIISRSELSKPQLANSKQTQSTIVAKHRQRILICNVHMKRCRWEEGLQELQERLNRKDYDAIIIGGDFNIDPTEDTTCKDFRQLERFVELNNLRLKAPEKFGTFGTRKGRTIDFFIVSENIAEHCHPEILPTTFSASDHLPVILSIYSEESIKLTKKWAPNPALLADPHVKDIVRNIITQTPGDELDQWIICKDRIVTETKKYHKKVQTQFFRDLHHYQKELSRLMRSQQPDTYKIDQAYKETQLLTEEMKARVSLESLEKGKRDRETATKAFFRQEMPKVKRSTMLTDPDPHLSPKEIAHRFYTKLYDKKTTNRKDQKSLISELPPFTRKQRKALNREITDLEVEIAINKANQASSPGPDGLNFFFYKKFQQELAPILTKIFNRILKGQDTVEGFNEATMILLHKKGDQSNVENYRPISITNCDNRLMSAIMARRLNPILEEYISEEQRGFIGGRCTQDLVIVTQSLIRRSVENRDNLTILQLDWEKAYDRIDHAYLFKCLEKTNGPGNFSQWVKTMYSTSYFKIQLNDVTTDKITPMSGVRQGCPISPLLFNITLEPLIRKVKKEKTWNGAYGTKQIFYADDSTFFITKAETLTTLMKLLKIYENGSGAKQNLKKSTALSTGTDTATERETQRLGYSIIHDETTLVGYPIGPSIDEGKMWETELQKIQKSIDFWQGRGLTVYGKKLIINAKIMSRMIYKASIFKIPTGILKKVEKKIDQFLFPKTHERLKSKPWRLKTRDGGLNIPNLAHINKALLTKLGLQLLAPSENFWKKPIREEAKRDLPSIILNESCPPKLPKWIRDIRKCTKDTIGPMDGKISLNGKEIPYTSYKTKLGRKLLGSRNPQELAIHRRWTPTTNDADARKRLATMRPRFYPKKLIEFRWKVATLTIYHFNWGKQINCIFCRKPITEISHVLTDCPFAKECWKIWETRFDTSLSKAEKILGPTKAGNRKWETRTQALLLLRKIWLNFWDRLKSEKGKTAQRLVDESAIESISLTNLEHLRPKTQKRNQSL